MNSFDLNTHSVLFQQTGSDAEGFENLVIKNNSSQTVYSRALGGQHTTIYVVGHVLHVEETPINLPDFDCSMSLNPVGACQKLIIKGYNVIGIEDLRAGLVSNHVFDLTTSHIDLFYKAIPGDDQFIIRTTDISSYSNSQGTC